VLKARGIRFEALAAASVGVLHALAWNRGDMVFELQEHWRDNVRRLRPFHPRRLLTLRNPFQFGRSFDGVVRRYRSTHPRIDDEGQVPITVSLTRAASGSNLLVNTSDPQWTDAERVAIYKAATTIPALGDGAVRIRGERYYDGGFTNNLPVEAFSGAGLDEVWLIPLFDLAAADRPGRGGTLARLVRAAGQRAASPWLLGAAGLWEQLLRPRSAGRIAPRVVTIAPAEPARFFTVRRALTFSQAHIDRLFERGRQDAERICREYHPPLRPSSEPSTAE
jgi:predicted acylesterase/phospholipase RssA